MQGKQLRIQRLFGRDKRMVMVPMDHGISLGPIEGIEDINKAVNEVSTAGIDAIVLHKGMAQYVKKLQVETSLIVHLSASTELGTDPLRKILVCSVEEAIRLGADAVSVHINLGCESESEQLSDAAIVARECNRWGIPLLTMAYPRGKGIAEFDATAVAHCVRYSGPDRQDKFLPLKV